jgi:hypothetical protein
MNPLTNLPAHPRLILSAKLNVPGDPWLPSLRERTGGRPRFNKPASNWWHDCSRRDGSKTCRPRPIRPAKVTPLAEW